MRKIVFLLLLLPLFGICQNGPFGFWNNNVQREFYLHVPANLPPNSPIVYVFHGLGGNGSGMMSTTDFNALADQNNFAVCYPTGLSAGSGYTIWDTDGLSDVDFILSLNDSLQAAHQFDVNRVFATGFSYGAEMSYHIASCQDTNTIAAIATVGGTMWDYTANGWPVVCTPSNDISVFVLHGTNDGDFNINGGNYQGVGDYLSVDSIVSFWSAYNSCSITSSYTLPDLNNDNDLTQVTKYCNASTGHKVWLYEVSNGLHEWFYFSPWGGSDFGASEEIWNFFSQTSCVSTSVVNELPGSRDRKLLKTLNLLGQEVLPTPNHLVVFVYDDGTIEKKMIIE